MVKSIESKQKRFSFSGRRLIFLKCLIGFFGLFFVLFIMFLCGHSIYVKSEPYQHSLELVKSNRKLRELIGNDYEVGWNVAGNLDEKVAILKYKLIGPFVTAIVEVEAEKMQFGWEYNKIQVTIGNDDKRKVDLLTSD